MDSTSIPLREWLTDKFAAVTTQIQEIRVEGKEQRVEERAWRLSIEARLTALERFQWRLIGAATIGGGLVAALIQRLLFG